ncbi:MAG: hypothetical protein QOH41_2324 [Blastocatellia bacterium]|jgi:YD repeat-containing protein|nr:hypothetical protein [Blastocatellia bacterium]
MTKAVSYQNTTMSYDGYGRLQSKHVPQQDVGTATVYAYNPDDTVQSVTDARGASAIYYYTARHLVASIAYSAPAGVTGTGPVNFSYDAAGNRTSMSDAAGMTAYAYDQLSRMSSETRTINGLGSYTIGYGYNLAGELTSVTDPFNAQVGYNHDNSGRVVSITGSGFANVSTYASNIQYRAWGAVKHLNYGNNLTLDAGYNSRLQATSFVIPNVINKSYQYNDDGSLGYSHDLIDQRFDRAYAYDHAARMTQALSGAEARGSAPTNDRPYKQTYSYDAFSHLNAQNTNHWTTFASSSDSYNNNRRAGWSYDAEGNLLTNYQQTYSYDAAGQMATAQSETVTTQSFDGNGQRVKTVETADTTTTTTFYVRSTVLGGQVLTELTSAGGKQRTFVYSGNQVLAWQESPYGSPRVMWEHRDPSNASFRMTDVNASMSTGTDQEQPAELDPLGFRCRDVQSISD